MNKKIDFSWVVLLFSLILAFFVFEPQTEDIVAFVIGLVLEVALVAAIFYVLQIKLSTPLYIHAMSKNSILPIALLGIAEGIVFGLFGVGVVMMGIYYYIVNSNIAYAIKSSGLGNNVLVENFMKLTFWSRMVLSFITFAIVYNTFV